MFLVTGETGINGAMDANFLTVFKILPADDNYLIGMVFFQYSLQVAIMIVQLSFPAIASTIEVVRRMLESL